MFAVLHACMTVCERLQDSTIWGCEGRGRGADGDVKRTERRGRIKEEKEKRRTARRGLNAEE